jgi:putative two-component system response regulator
MSAAELSKLLVSYRDDSSYENLSRLIAEADSVLQSFVASNSEDDLERLREPACVIGEANWRQSLGGRSLDGLASTAHRVLLGVAVAHIPRAAPERAIRFAERALDIAIAYELKEETRRGFNVCSALYVLAGATADAVEYGLMAASLAKQLGYAAAAVNSLANVNAALMLMGLHDEAVKIADRVFAAFAEDQDCAMDVALVNTNAAKAALTLKRYDTAKQYSQRAIAGLSIDSAHDASYRVINEFTWMQCAIATEDIATANARMIEIDRIAAQYPSPRNDLNRRFAAALHLGFTQKAPLATIGQLGYLTAAASKFVPIYTEVLQHLATLCSEAGDHRSALYYAGELVDSVGHARLGKLRDLIAELGQKPNTIAPQKGSAQSVIDRIVAKAIEPTPAPVRVETLADPALAKALERLAATAELCDEPSRLGIYRVGKLAGLLARELGYTEAQAVALEHAARLHDIGKLGIPSVILAKPSVRLNESEYQVMWRHAAMGAQILRQCGEPIFELAAEIAHAHHEAWDGTGYPRNLQGEEIHEAARMVCLAENYDSMTHSRSYRHRMTHPEAVAFIRKNSGGQFDPVMTLVFIRLVERLRMLHGERMNVVLAEDAPMRNEYLADESLLQRLNDLVPNSVFEKLRGGLFVSPEPITSEEQEIKKP